MLQRLFISSCAVLLLVGCSTTETKPVRTQTPSAPAKVSQPPAKAVNPVLKPKLAIKPKAAPVKPPAVPVKAAASAPVNADAVLGKQWAACAGRINGLYLFGQDALKFNPAVRQQPSFKSKLADYEKLPVLRDSLYAYASAATSARVVEAEFNRLSVFDHQTMKSYMDGFLKATAAGENFAEANDKWGGRYFKHGKQLLQDILQCARTLDKQHTRFDAQIRPSLQVKALETLLTASDVANTSKKVAKKRGRKAS